MNYFQSGKIILALTLIILLCYVMLLLLTVLSEKRQFNGLDMTPMFPLRWVSGCAPKNGETCAHKLLFLPNKVAGAFIF